MRRYADHLCVIAFALVTASCGANFSSIFRSYDAYDNRLGAPETQSVLIDAKQRAILAAPVDSASWKDSDKSRARKVLLCAEPSPDALSAISSTFAGSFGGVFGPGKEVQASLAQAFTETASQLGNL